MVSYEAYALLRSYRAITILQEYGLEFEEKHAVYIDTFIVNRVIIALKNKKKKKAIEIPAIAQLRHTLRRKVRLNSAKMYAEKKKLTPYKLAE